MCIRCRQRLRYFVRWDDYDADFLLIFQPTLIGMGLAFVVGLFADLLSQIAESVSKPCGGVGGVFIKFVVVIYANCPQTWCGFAGACLLIYQFGVNFFCIYLPRGFCSPITLYRCCQYLNLAAVGRCHVALYAMSVLRVIMYQFNATIPIILASTSPRRRELLDQFACAILARQSTLMNHG